MKQSDILLLAGLGLGAYYLYTKSPIPEVKKFLGSGKLPSPPSLLPPLPTMTPKTITTAAAVPHRFYRQQVRETGRDISTTIGTAERIIRPATRTLSSMLREATSRFGGAHVSPQDIILHHYRLGKPLLKGAKITTRDIANLPSKVVNFVKKSVKHIIPVSRHSRISHAVKTTPHTVSRHLKTQSAARKLTALRNFALRFHHGLKKSTFSFRR